MQPSRSLLLSCMHKTCKTVAQNNFVSGKLFLTKINDPASSLTLTLGVNENNSFLRQNRWIKFIEPKIRAIQMAVVIQNEAVGLACFCLLELCVATIEYDNTKCSSFSCSVQYERTSMGKQYQFRTTAATEQQQQQRRWQQNRQCHNLYKRECLKFFSVINLNWSTFPLNRIEWQHTEWKRIFGRIDFVAAAAAARPLISIHCYEYFHNFMRKYANILKHIRILNSSAWNWIIQRKLCAARAITIGTISYSKIILLQMRNFSLAFQKGDVWKHIENIWKNIFIPSFD